MRFFYGGYIYEAVNINKDFLLKQVGGDVSVLNSKKELVNGIISKAVEGFSTSSFPDKSRQWLTNQLTSIAIKGDLPKDLSSFIHDVIVDGKFNHLQQLNSDSEPSDLTELIRSYRSMRLTNSKEKLSAEEECIWLRVKLFHQFEDGYKWVNALDAEGELAGFIPSGVTFKTMNHCGNTPSVQPGDVYYGLRDSNDVEYLSVIVDAEGKIRESKGYGNKRPTRDVKKYVQWLMKHDNIKGTNYGAGYARHMNYGVSYMTDDEDFMSYVQKDKPSLVDETDELIIDLKTKLSKGLVTSKDVINLFHRRSSFESFSFEQLIGILGGNPFSEEEMIANAKDGSLTCLEVANAGKEYLTVKLQHAFIDAMNDRAEDPEYSIEDDTTVPTLISIMSEVPHNNIDGYYLFMEQGHLIHLNMFEEDPLPGFMTNSKKEVDKIMATPRLAKYLLRAVTDMVGGYIDFLKTYSDVIHSHINAELRNSYGMHSMTDIYLEAAVKSGLVFGYNEMLGLAEVVNSSNVMNLSQIINYFSIVRGVNNEDLLKLYIAYKPAIMSASSTARPNSIANFINVSLRWFVVDNIKLKFAKEFSDIIYENHKVSSGADKELIRLAYEDGYNTYWKLFPSEWYIEDMIPDEDLAHLVKSKPRPVNESSTTYLYMGQFFRK